jgi:hypothetical protein
MRVLLILLVFYVAAWMIAAVFDFSGSDTVRVYQLAKINIKKEGFPERYSLNPTTYRMMGQSVVAQTGSLPPKKYDRCAVIDRDNWECEYDDSSAKFGIANGSYYTDPPSSVMVDFQNVSRFGYIINGARWWLAEDDPLRWVPVMLMPFTR